jgi:copper homeostasis protein CutC
MINNFDGFYSVLPGKGVNTQNRPQLLSSAGFTILHSVTLPPIARYRMQLRKHVCARGVHLLK